MKMKKVLMILITLAMVFTMAGAVSAEDKTYTETYDEGDKQTVVNYTEDVDDAYTIIIPSEINLQKQNDGTINGTLQVNVTNVRFNTTGWASSPTNGNWNKYTKLNIGVASSESWRLVNHVGGIGGDYYQYVPYTAILKNYDNYELGDYNVKTNIHEGGSFCLHGGDFITNKCNVPAVADIELEVTNPSDIIVGGEYKDTLTFNVAFEKVGFD